MKNIEDLRLVLFNELAEVTAPGAVINRDRVQAVVALAEQLVDAARLEVQLAVVQRGAMEIPFIESAQSERANPDRGRESSTAHSREMLASGKVTPMQRAAQVLGGGPSPDHPWRDSDPRKRN